MKNIIACFLTMLNIAYPAWAIDALKVGDLAPNFQMAGSDDSIHNLSDYRGSMVVIAWFPKAFTGG